MNSCKIQGWKCQLKTGGLEIAATVQDTAIAKWAQLFKEGFGALRKICSDI